jgi:hypothetical protein
MKQESAFITPTWSEVCGEAHAFAHCFAGASVGCGECLGSTEVRAIDL